MNYVIRPAEFPADADALRVLFREYQTAIGIDLSFQDFDDELAGLPGDYAEPRGVVLCLATPDELVGCAALRPFTGADAEMKRFYIKPSHRGRGAARMLAAELIVRAHEAGYARLLLDTIPGMDAAQRLYEALGFTDVPAYRHNPVEGARYLALRLG